MHDPSFLRRRDALAGMELTFIWRGYATAVFLEFGRLRHAVLNGRRQNHPTGDMSIGLGWTWRIEDGTTILAGSAGEESGWQAVFDRLLGRKVADVDLAGCIPELVIELDDESRLQTFGDYGAEPGWTIAERIADGSAGHHLHWQAGAFRQSP